MDSKDHIILSFWSSIIDDGKNLVEKIQINTEEQKQYKEAICFHLIKARLNILLLQETGEEKNV